MTKRNIFIVACIAVIALVFFIRKSKNHPLPKKAGADDMLAVVAEPFEIHNGWGYRVNVDGHTFIYQDVVPGVPGNRVFRSKENALRVGNAVVEKLTHHKRPAITQQELINMQIPEAE